MRSEFDMAHPDAECIRVRRVQYRSFVARESAYAQTAREMYLLAQAAESPSAFRFVADDDEAK